MATLGDEAGGVVPDLAVFFEEASGDCNDMPIDLARSTVRLSRSSVLTFGRVWHWSPAPTDVPGERSRQQAHLAEGYLGGVDFAATDGAVGHRTPA